MERLNIRKNTAGLFLVSIAVLFFETLLSAYVIFISNQRVSLVVLSAAFAGVCCGSMIGKRIQAFNCCVSILVSMMAVFIVTLLVPGSWGIYRTILYCLVIMIPFLFFGALVSQILEQATSFGNAYAMHLFGCGLGVIFAICLFPVLGFERSILLVVIMILVGAWLYSHSYALKMVIAILCVYVFLGPLPDLVQVANFMGALRHKDLFSAVDSIEFTHWDSVGRVDKAKFYDREYIYFNGRAFTEIADKEYYNSIRAIPFEFYVNPKTLVVGVGGGKGIATARHFTNNVTGIEISPGIVQLMSQEQIVDSDIYSQADIVTREGRFFLSSTVETYDIIILWKTWGASS